MMKAKSRGGERLTGTDRLRVKVKMTGRRERGGGGVQRVRESEGVKKWTAAMKLETKKKKRQTDKETSPAMWIHPGDHQLTWHQIREVLLRKKSGMKRERESRRKTKQTI